MPESLMEVWIWFKRLSNRRQSGMGINPIMYSEMKAFFDMNGINPLPEEVWMIETFDNLSTDYFSKKQAKPQPAQGKGKT